MQDVPEVFAVFRASIVFESINLIQHFFFFFFQAVFDHSHCQHGFLILSAILFWFLSEH